MALPLANTFQRFETQAAIKAGKYSNIRIKQMSTNMNPAVPWSTLASAADKIVTAGGWGGYGNFDIILDHLLRLFQHDVTPHAPCKMSRADRVLTGAWNPIDSVCL